MENSLKSILEKSKSVMILLPTRPYFDQVAAGLSLFLGLNEDKNVHVSSPSPMTVEFNRLVGVNKISQELGSKNLLIRFTDYKANDIERVSYDIEDGQFKLTVIPKAKINPPTREQIQFSYSGVSSDTVILIGGANETHFPALASKDLAGVNLVHVGTRDIALSPGKSLTSFVKPVSSVSEVTANLMKESGIRIDPDVASNLLMGIEEGSNSFSGQGVTSETFALVSELMRAGGKREVKSDKEESFPPGAIPGTIQSQQQTTRQPVEEDNLTEKEETPKEWFEPKIFKGTSIK